MAELVELLAELEAQWRRHDLLIVQHLRPGLSPEYVRDRLDATGLAAPAELVEWFTWHDGAPSSGWMTPFYHIESFDKCLEYYTNHTEAYHWHPSLSPEDPPFRMFPIATSLSGSYLVVDTGEEGTGKVSVGSRSRELEDVPVDWRLPSLADLVRVWVDLFARDRWTRSPYPREVVSHLTDEEIAQYPWTFRQQAFVL